MNRRTIVWLGAFAALAAAHPLMAQSKPVRKGVARSAPPAKPVIVNTTGLPVVPVQVPASPPAVTPPVGPAGIAQVTWYPTVVLTDGRVLANFGTGRGYEQVLRQCPQALPPNATIAPCWTVDAYGNFGVMQRR